MVPRIRDRFSVQELSGFTPLWVGKKTACWEDVVCSGAGRDTEGVFVWEVVYHIEYLKVGGLWFYVLHGYLACAFLWVIASVCVIDSTFRTNVAIFLFVTFYYYFSPLPEGV